VKPSTRRAINQFSVAYSFLGLPLVFLLSFTFLPSFISSILSFFHYIPGVELKFVGFSNYKRMINDQLFWIALGNSLKYLIVVPLLQLIAFVVAVIVNQPLRGAGLIRTIIYLPVITSIVVVGILWRELLASEGLINRLLISFGIISSPISWLTNPSLALWAVMSVTIWKGIGYYMVIYLAGLRSISKEFKDAAVLDGASPWQLHWHITFPLLKPYFVLCTILSSISALKVFAEVYVLTPGGGVAHSTTTLLYYIYTTAFGPELDMGYGATIGIGLALLVAVVSFINFHFFREGGWKYYN